MSYYPIPQSSFLRIRKRSIFHAKTWENGQRRGKYFLICFAIKNAACVYSLSTGFPILFIICLARLLSKGTCVIEDQSGNKETIPFTGIFKQSLRFLREYLKRNSYYLRKKQEVESWLEQPPYTPSSPLNLNHPPIYLRTDHSFGLSSGGSVGHTLGVANNLEAFTQKPYMASTVFFPMLNDRIHKLQLKPSSRFLNFQELLFLRTMKLFHSKSILLSKAKTCPSCITALHFIITAESLSHKNIISPGSRIQRFGGMGQPPLAVCAHL